MSNPNTFIESYSSNIVEFVRLMQALRVQNDQLVQDPTIVTRYFAQSAGADFRRTAPRTDIVAVDVTNAQAALVQLLFAFDSGSPTQKSFLYKMLP